MLGDTTGPKTIFSRLARFVRKHLMFKNLCAFYNFSHTYRKLALYKVVATLLLCIGIALFLQPDPLLYFSDALPPINQAPCLLRRHPTHISALVGKVGLQFSSKVKSKCLSPNLHCHLHPCNARIFFSLFWNSTVREGIT